MLLIMMHEVLSACSSSMFVLSIICWTLMSSVQPVQRSAVFCIICSVCCGCNRWSYSIGLVTALNDQSNVSLCFAPFGQKKSFEYCYSFGCFGCCVVNVFVVSEFRICDHQCMITGRLIVLLHHLWVRNLVCWWCVVCSFYVCV